MKVEKLKTKAKRKLWRTQLKSPIGTLEILATENGISRISWDGEHANVERFETTRAPRCLEQAKKQLHEYFTGKRKNFDLPLDVEGTEFQQEAWKVLRRIPYGHTISYGEQAKQMGDPKKARAVGGANGKNPISIIVPCHRVIGKDGSLTGFGGGLSTKEFLLQLEAR